MIILIIVCHPTKILHNYWLYFQLQMVTIIPTAAVRLKEVRSGKKSYDKPRQCIEKKRHYFADKFPCSQRTTGPSSGHVWLCELDHKEGWVPKNWGFWTVVLEKTLESPLDCKEIKPVHPKGDQSLIFIGRTDAEAEIPSLTTWCEELTQLIEGRRRNGVTEDEMVGWHHWLSGHEFEQGMGDSEGQERLGVLQSTGSESTGHNLATKQQQQYFPHSPFYTSDSYILYLEVCISY